MKKEKFAKLLRTLRFMLTGETLTGEQHGKFKESVFPILVCRDGRIHPTNQNAKPPEIEEPSEAIHIHKFYPTESTLRKIGEINIKRKWVCFCGAHTWVEEW